MHRYDNTPWEGSIALDKTKENGKLIESLIEKIQLLTKRIEALELLINLNNKKND